MVSGKGIRRTAGAVLVAACLGGCETEPVNRRIIVTPSSATLQSGQWADFTASGGYEYTWSLENEGWGVLSSRHGMTVRYTSTYSPDPEAAENPVQILRVTSTITGTGGTNTTSYSASGEAYITHF